MAASLQTPLRRRVPGPLAGATNSAVDLYLRSTTQYFGDPAGGYKTFNFNPTPWNHYRLVSP